eukprot:3945025-Prymnesium_polylepis.1
MPAWLTVSLSQATTDRLSLASGPRPRARHWVHRSGGREGLPLDQPQHSVCGAQRAAVHRAVDTY